MKAIGCISGIGSMLIGARQAGFNVVGNWDWRKYYHARDEEGRNTFTENFPGAYFSRSPDEHIIGLGKDIELMLSHCECLPAATSIFTSDGWRPIRTLKIGDLVLTHQGRFRRVMRTYKNQAQGNKVTLNLSTKRTVQRSLTLTEDHPILRDDGKWVAAKNIQPGQSIITMAGACITCGEAVPFHPHHAPQYCSTSCAAKDQWKEGRATVQAAHEKTRERCRNGSHQFHDPVIRRKGQLTLSRRSEGEQYLLERLEKEGLTATPQYPVGPYFIDAAITDHKIAIEVDGGKWHGTRADVDARRDNFLENEGWIVIRTNNRRENIESAIEKLQRILANHSGEYRFTSAEVLSVDVAPFKQKTTVYNIGVEEDESYIAKGFVVHNCGAYSALSGANKDYRDRQANDQSDLPKLIDFVQKTKPQFFVADNLPKSLGPVPLSAYAEKLPEYDLFPEWISNYGYGNIQKGRNRFFLIGSLKDHRYVFQAGEAPHNVTVADVLGDMGQPGASNIPNHDMCALNEDSPRAFNMYEYGRKNTWADAKRYFEAQKEGHIMKYISKSGREVLRIGYIKGKWNGDAYVLTGGNPTVHALRNEPYTIRERARIQGFPDDFIFYGTKYNKLGQWNHNDNLHMVKQTGKGMPVEFNRYVSVQIAAHIQNAPYETTNRRILLDNPEINSAKNWYCENIGYSNQEKACDSCWLKETCNLPRKI